MTRQMIVLILLILVQSHEPTLNIEIRYGNMIKLRHKQSSLMLHSHDVKMGRAQVYSVTGYKIDDLGSYWQIKQQFPKLTKIANHPIHCGDVVVITSCILQYNLRLEETTFGLTTQLMPMLHGVHSAQNNNINWQIQCVNKKSNEKLQFYDLIRLKHSRTGKYIAIVQGNVYTIGNCGQGCSILHQAQIHGVQYSDRDDTIFQLLPGLSVVDQTL